MKTRYLPMLQLSELQLFVSSAFPVHLRPPPVASKRTLLFLLFVPPPHDREHLDHSPNRDHVQSVGQTLVLQFFFICRGPEHLRPPPVASTRTLLLFLCVPHHKTQSTGTIRHIATICNQLDKAYCCSTLFPLVVRSTPDRLLLPLQERFCSFFVCPRHMTQSTGTKIQIETICNQLGKPQCCSSLFPLVDLSTSDRLLFPQQ